MIELWEWIVLVLLMVIMYLIGYYHLLDRLGAGISAWWGRRHIRTKYESLKERMDIWQSDKEAELAQLRERLRAYFLKVSEKRLWYDEPIKNMVIDNDMGLVVSDMSMDHLHAFYAMVSDKNDDILKPSHPFGYKVHHDWWIYFAGQIYRENTIIRQIGAPLPETKKVPKIDGSDES